MDILRVITIIIIVSVISIFILDGVKVPYDAKESYQEQEPYQEEVCEYKLPPSQDVVGLTIQAINRLIDVYQTEDPSRLIKECKMETKYRTVTKTRTVTRYHSMSEEIFGTKILKF